MKNSILPVLFVFGLFAFILFTPMAVSDDFEQDLFWSRNDNTIVLTNSSHNVNIGENKTTTYRLNVNGTSNLKGVLTAKSTKIYDSSVQQLIVGFDKTNYAFLEIDTCGDLTIRTTGTDIDFYNNNLSTTGDFEVDNALINGDLTVDGDFVNNLDTANVEFTIDEATVFGFVKMPEIVMTNNLGSAFGSIRGILYIRAITGSPSLFFSNSDASIASSLLFNPATKVFKHSGMTKTDLDNQDVILSTDNKKLLFGSIGDASIYYDGTDMLINPKEVGSGELRIEGVTNSTGGFVLPITPPSTAVAGSIYLETKNNTIATYDGKSWYWR